MDHGQYWEKALLSPPSLRFGQKTAPRCEASSPRLYVSPFRSSEMLGAPMLAKVGRHPGPDWGAQKPVLPQQKVWPIKVVLDFWLSLGQKINCNMLWPQKWCFRHSWQFTKSLANKSGVFGTQSNLGLW